MKRPLKLLLIVMVVLLLLVGAGILGLSGYVQSESGRARIEGELGKALGVPLQIRRASLGWGALRLLDVRIVGEGRDFLTAPVFSTEYEVGPLFQRQVVLRKMVLESPQIIWPQNAQGQWVLPLHTKEPKTTPPTTKAPSEKKGFQVALDTLEIKHGSIELQDAVGARMALGQDIHIQASLATAGEATADATMASLGVGATGPTFENVSLPFQYSAGKLTFPRCEGTLGGGTVRGSLALETKSAKAPFDLQLTVENVDLARAITAPEWQIHSGRLQASLTLAGTQHDFQRGQGRGELHVTQASVEALEPLLRLIGVACHVPELAALRLSLQNNVGAFADMLGIPEVLSLREARAVFQLNKKETVVEQLLVDATDLQVQAKGTIGQDGKLNLAANLNLADKLTSKMPTFLRDSLQPVEGTALRGIDFHITGKNDRPKTDLGEKVLGGQLSTQFNSIVDGIFGGSKEREKKEEDKKRDEEKKRDKEEKKKKKDADKAEKEAAKQRPQPAPADTLPAPPPPAAAPGSTAAPEAPPMAPAPPAEN